MRQRILVVDDDDAMREMMALALAKEGFRVETAGSAADGIAVLRETDFDLVIACLNDDAEPNDALADATTLALDNAPVPSIACPDDIDRFETDVTSGTIRVTLNHGGSSLSFDVRELVSGELVALDMEIDPGVTSTTLEGTIDHNGTIVTTIDGAFSRTSYSLEATQTID